MKIALVSKFDYPIVIYASKGVKFTKIFLTPNDTVYATVRKGDKGYELVLLGNDSLNTQFIESFNIAFPYRNEQRLCDDLDLTNYKELVLNKTLLYDYLYLKSIPRGVILDYQHKIKKDKAPRLHIEFINDLETAIDGLQSQVVTFF